MVLQHYGRRINSVLNSLKKLLFKVLLDEKTQTKRSGFFKKEPGGDLLSHNRTLHYHRRDCISLLCSEWEQVVLQHYGRRTYSV